MRQVVNPVEHDILAIILTYGPCSAPEIARVLQITDITKIFTILGVWIDEAIINNSLGIYTVRSEKKFILENELIRYEATLPPMAYSLYGIAPAAADSLSFWKDMVLRFESGGVPEKDYELYLQGISVMASKLLRKLAWTLGEIAATDEFIKKLMSEINTKMVHLTAPLNTEKTKEPTKSLEPKT